MIWQSLLRPREGMMACIYSNAFIRLAEGIQPGGTISEEIKAKWQEESEGNIRTDTRRRNEPDTQPDTQC